ncbi:MAG: SUMF1/EgtB/PvdO family nonheme iron enzyme [Verrucomicrobiota bacterium]
MAEYIWGTGYRQYLQNQAFVKDVTVAMRSAARDTAGAIGTSTRSILVGMEQGVATTVAAQREATDRLVEAQMEAAHLTAEGLERVAGAIDDLHSCFRWGFSQMLARIGAMNDSLQSLIRVAKTPAQTAAYEQFEIARDAFRQQLFGECLEALGRAINGDHTSPGYKLEWRFHELEAIVRLGFAGCDVSLVDPVRSEQSFLLATRYAKTDYPKEAARAFLSAGWAAFIRENLPDALRHTEAAIELDGRLGEALFQAAKVRMALGQPGQALPVLRQAIELDRGYAVKAAGDSVFQQFSPDLDSFLAALRSEKLKGLQDRVKGALAELLPLASKAPALARHPFLLQLQSLAAGGGEWGLMDLLHFERERFDSGLKEVHDFLKQLRWRYEARDEVVSVEREVDEPFQEQETVWENVVVKPGGLFRKAVTERVKKTVTVTRHRTVRRAFSEKSRALVNGFGEALALPDGFDVLRWVVVPPGRFMMGAGEDDEDDKEESYAFRADARPQHWVTLTRAILMQTTPVTNGLWKALMGDKEHLYGGDDIPVHVNWFRTVAYCNRLSKTFGIEEAYVLSDESHDIEDFRFSAKVRWKGLACPGFRLPTEAEWEYACRAGTSAPRYGTLDDVAWYNGNCDGSETPLVGKKQPNAFGMYDMLGLVWEWCWDGDDPYQQDSVTDPVGPDSSSKRVARGGAWSATASRTRAAARRVHEPGRESGDLGFRPTRSLA